MIIYNFYKIFQELSVAHCLSSDAINSSALQSPQQVQSLSFLAIDIYAKLVFSILKVNFLLINSTFTVSPLILYLVYDAVTSFNLFFLPC